MRTLVPFFTVCGFLLCVVFAFGDQPATQPAGQRQTTASGLTIISVDAGDGAARPGDLVYVHYTGRFEDGRVFDSSQGKDPISFQLGAGRVIKGWEEGLQGMKVGEKRQLIIPPALAYGEAGSRDGTIPPNATLHFDVELMGLVRR